MSSVNVAAENAFNKVLPGDKTGLPWEIWQYLLSWMSARDLCRLARVCKTWTDLVISVDSTLWKQLYMACSEWRHPFWPLNTQAEPTSWRLAYRDQYLATKFWRHRQQREARTVSCSLLFKKSIVRRTIHVGPGLEHECLKTALSVINEYDRVVVHPGIYDELFEISSKIPFELVGEGELGSVILVVGIQQVGAAARLSNLVLRAPWFTSFIIMINSGYLQIDSCILEDGMICAQNPATVHVKFCTFRHATVILQHMNASIIENCEFSQSDSANVIVEGYPKEERNWTYGFLRERTDAVFSQKRSLHRKRRGLKTTTSLASSTVHSSLTGKSIATNGGGWSSATTYRQQSSDAVSHDPSFSMEDPGASFLHPSLLPGARFLTLPPDNTGMVGCGDLQSLYHDGTCDTADTEQQSTHYVDFNKRRSASVSAPLGMMTSSEHILEKGKEGYKEGSDVDKYSSVKRLSSAVEPDSNASMLRTRPSEVCPDKVNQLPCGDNSRKDKQDSVRPKVPRKLLQQAWGDAEPSNKSPGSGIKGKASSANTEFSTESCDKGSKSQEIEWGHGQVKEDNYSSSVRDSAPDRQYGQRQCKHSDGLQGASVESAQATTLDGKENDEVVKSEPPATNNLICRTKQARRRQTPLEALDPFNSGGVHSNESGVIGKKHLEKSVKSSGGQNSHAQVHRFQGLEEYVPVTHYSDTSENSRHNSSHTICKLCLYPSSETSRVTSFAQASPQKDVAENASVLKSDSILYGEDSGSKDYAHIYKPGPSKDGGNVKVSSSLFVNVRENGAGTDGNEAPPSCLHHFDQLSAVAAAAVPSHDFPLNCKHHHHNHQQHHHHQERHLQDSSHQQSYSHKHHPHSDQDHHHHCQDPHHRYHHHQQQQQQQQEEGLPPIHIPIRRSQSQELENPVSDDDLSILDELADSDDSSDVDDMSNHNSSSDSTTDSSSITNSLHFSGSEDSFASSEESVIMLPHLREFHPEGGQGHLNQSTTSPRGVQAEVASINSECTRPVPVDVSEDTLMSSYVGQIQGCLIHQCRMNHSKGGLMISLQAHAIVSECDISNVSYGIRCIQNSRAVILKNKIHHCRTSGIFMRLAASGLIAGNDIHSNNEAGIDIRKNADPLVQFNQIHHGKRSGVVVLGSGRGQIKKNDIYRNQEAGVYVLYGGNPTISENYIYEGKAAGVAVNAGGRGCIIDNVIRGNQWGGVDIRNSSCPLVAGNSIINGLSDGVVVGLGGRGTIESNFISGNGGCGLWMMAAKNLYIHGNQISNSGHSGVILLNKSASAMESHLGQLLTNVSHRSFSQQEDTAAAQEPKTNWATLQYNNIFNNNGHGIVIEIKEEVRMFYNAVHGNHRDGILMSQCAPALLEGNSITSNCGNGVVTSSQDNMRLVGNGIYDNGYHGIVCRTNCVVEGNDVAGHSQASVVVEAGANVQLKENRFCSSPSGACAIRGEESAVILAVSNKIFIRGGGDFSGCGNFTAVDNVLVKPSNPVSRKQSRGDFNKTEFLTDPPPRPHIKPPPPSTAIPTHYVTVVTKVTVPSAESCEQGSKFCNIL